MNKKLCKISASLMCADPYNLKSELNILNNENIDYFHIDIMDGHFVPNYGLSLDFCKKIKKNSKIPFDYHLMIEEPHKLIPILNLQENDIVSIHYESTYYIKEVIEQIKKTKAKLFIAIKPTTPIIILDSIIEYINGINFLTVNPGFAGQQILDISYKKAEKLIDYINKRSTNSVDFEVDGNMNLKNIKIFKELGANIFVVGSSSLFGKNDMKNELMKIKKILISEV